MIETGGAAADAVRHLPHAHGRRRERVGFLLGAVVFSNFFLLTLYVQQVLGYSALKTGLTFLATAGTVVLLAGVCAGARRRGSGRGR